MIRLLVCGSRTLEDKQQYIFATLDKLVGHNQIDVLICGMAKGVDIISYFWAKERGINIIECPADWKKYGKAAGPIRNQQMLDEEKPTHVIAFQDCRVNPNGSNGTNHMIRISKAKNVPVKTVFVK